MAQAGIEDSAGKLWQLWMSALWNTQPKLLAYLLYMTERLIVMKGILKPSGSIYLHCDPTASHYIKSLMDAIFGVDNFLNEIIWKCTSAHSNATRKLAAVHDMILVYGKSGKTIWNQLYVPYSEDYIAEHFVHLDPDGRRFRRTDLVTPGVRSNLRYDYLASNGRIYKSHPNGWKVSLAVMKELDRENRLFFPAKDNARLRKKIYIDESPGVPLTDIWDDLRPIHASSQERLGYPTQKPVALLERIIAMSSNERQTVLDPFCGCATTIAAAHKLNRRWIGIDIAYHAIKRVAQVRLQDEYGLVEGVNYTVSGVPRTLEGAQNPWHQDKYGFQRWAVEQVNGFVTTKRTADGGIDGRLWFALPGEKQLRSMVLEVKGGKNVGINIVRDLRGALERDEAAMAGLIIMEPLPDRQRQNFIKEMMSAGMLDVMGVQYPRMQILSVPEILDKRMFLTPSVAGRGTGQGNLPLQDTR